MPGWAEIAALYRQHTAESGQEFTPEAVDKVFCYTQGRSWLVNALANEITFEMAVPLDQPVTAGHVEQAWEILVRGRATNLESLEYRLHEERVARVMARVVQGEVPSYPGFDQDKRYLQDLGTAGGEIRCPRGQPVLRRGGRPHADRGPAAPGGRYVAAR
jgi:hypothetical protein